MEVLGVKWTDVVLAAGSVIGFVLVIYQLMQLRHSIAGEAHGKLYAQYVELGKLLLARPHLYPYFFECKRLEGKEADNTALRNELSMMCELTLGLLEHAVVQRVNLPEDSWENCWRAYTYDRFANSSELRSFFEAKRKWYARSFCEVIDARRP
jgi:hypothetical protein